MRETSVIRVIIFVFMTLCAVSCTKEHIGLSSDVGINLSMRAAVGEVINGVEVSTLRLIAAQEGKIVFNRTIADGGLVQSDVKEIKFDIAPGEYDFYAVINEIGDLSRVSSVLDLMRIHVPQAVTKVDASLVTEKRLCLFGSCDGVVIRKRYDNSPQVSLDGGIQWQMNLPINMERVAIKLGLLFKADPGVTAKVKSIKLRQVPGYSLLGRGQYTDNTFQSEKTIFSGTIDIGETANDIVRVIMPEYLLSMTTATDGTNATEVVVDYEVMGQARTSVVKLYHHKDGVNKDYNLYRDNFYHLTLTVKYPDIEIKTVVLPWNIMSITDNNGVEPTIKKVIEDFTPYDGIAEFTLGLNRAAQWRVEIDNPNDFMIMGAKTNTGVGDMGGAFAIKPLFSLNDGGNRSTNVYVVVNGQIVDETVVRSVARAYEFGWYSLNDAAKTNSLYVADRNMGAASPKSAGMLYKFGSKVGTRYNSPTFAITPSVTNAVDTYQITNWERRGERYVASAFIASAATDWALIPYQSTGGVITPENNPCPDGWRVTSQDDFTQFITPKLTAETVKTYGDFARASISGRILTDDKGSKQYFPVMHYRETTGVLSPNSAITHGYYRLSANAISEPQTLALTSSDYVVKGGSAQSGYYHRCVAEPFEATNKSMGHAQRSYPITVKPLLDKPWTITITSGDSWLKFSEDITWGTGQTTVIVGEGEKSFYLQPTLNTTTSARIATLHITDGIASKTISISQNAETAIYSSIIFATDEYNPEANMNNP